MFAIRNGLTWADWCYASQNKLALRHLDNSNRAMAEKELRKDGNGDGCSLVIPGLEHLMPNDVSSEDSRIVTIIDYAIEQLITTRWKRLNTSKLHDKDSLEVFRSKLEHSTTLSQKKDYLTAIFNLFLADWVRSCQDWEQNVGKDFYFLVIVHPNAHNPFDFDRGYALGKCGSGTRWKVHHKMTQVFTFEAKSDYESNFNSLAGRIQNLRTGDSIREFPNSVEEPNNKTEKSNNKLLLVAIAVPVVLFLGLTYWCSRDSSNKKDK